MKSFKFLVIISLALIDRSSSAPSQHDHDGSGVSNCEEPSDPTCEICVNEYVYECVNEWVHYDLNDAPATDGLYIGDYQGKPAYVGRGSINNALGAARIQTSDPKGAYQVYAGSETYISDPAFMWYLKRNDDYHIYEWVGSKDGEDVDYAVDTGDCEVDAGYDQYITKNYLGESVTIGIGSTIRGVNYFADLNKIMRTTTEYLVLTCKSKVYHPKPTCPPKPPSTPPAGACVNEWKFFVGDNAPELDGIAVGLHDVDDMIYVGATDAGSFMRPKGLEANVPIDDAYYLAQNSNYNYFWVDSRIGENLPNAVNTGGGNFARIGRVQINGKMILGTAGHPIGFYYLAEDGSGHFTNDYQVLVCEPELACPCEPKWLPYKNDHAPEVDGISFGTINGHVNYIGRSVQKLPEGYATVYGRVHPTHGVHVINDASGREEVDETDGEYLQKSSTSTYDWVQSHTDQKVKNALRVPIRCDNFTTCDAECDDDGKSGYIGRATIDGVTYVGTVYKNVGLVIADSCGSKMTLSNFEVLTCATIGPCNKKTRSCGNTDCGWEED